MLFYLWTVALISSELTATNPPKRTFVCVAVSLETNLSGGGYRLTPLL